MSDRKFWQTHHAHGSRDGAFCILVEIKWPQKRCGVVKGVTTGIGDKERKRERERESKKERERVREKKKYR